VLGIHLNPVEVSWIALDIDVLNEATSSISVHSDIQLMWMDCRWAYLVGGPNATHGPDGKVQLDLQSTIDLSSMAGQYDLWKAAASHVLSSYSAETCAVAATAFWTPIPRQLLPLTSDNSKGIADGDIFIQNLNFMQEGLNHALLVDSDPIHFDFNFDYQHFPFDRQVLELDLKFDPTISPEISKSLLFLSPGGALTMQGLDWVRNRSQSGYEASKFSPHLGQKVVDRFAAKGFDVVDADLIRVQTGDVWRIEIKLTIDRNWIITLPRFFFPLGLLVLVSFAGLWLPVGQVMPRVATGFVSFLSLSVYRTMAYDMIPKQTASLLWMDVIMLSITEVIFIVVMENVVAQAVNAVYSSKAARFVDCLFRVMIPVTTLVLMAVIFTMGFLHTDPWHTMIAAQTVIGSSMFVSVIILKVYLRCLPRILMKTFVKELSSKKLLWKDGLKLDENELAAVFEHIDCDRSGKITVDETIHSFEEEGLRFKTDSEWVNFHDTIKTSCGGNKDDEAEVELGLDEFREHFKELLGGKLVRRLHHTPIRDSFAV
jgi:hypothetical protein